MSGLEMKNIRGRLGPLTPKIQIAVATAAANWVMPIFASRWPESQGTALNALNYCWLLADEKANPSELNDWSERVGALVPDSEADPEAGAAIPAGEAILAVLSMANEPNQKNTAEAIEAAYTAVEMQEYLLGEASGRLGGSKTAADVIKDLQAAQRASNPQGFMAYMDRVLSAAASGGVLAVRQTAIH